jgi:hypothetical protein
MRRWLAFTLVVLAVGLLAACGSSGKKENAQTLPPAPALTVPGGEEAPPLTGSDSGATGTTGATGATGSSSPSSGTGGGSAPSTQAPANTVGNAGGGAQAPSSDGGGNKQTTTAPSGGAQAPSSQKGLSDFCKQNPGACQSK